MGFELKRSVGEGAIIYSLIQDGNSSLSIFIEQAGKFLYLFEMVNNGLIHGRTKREKFEREFCSRKEAEREAHEILKRQFEMSSYLTGHDSQKLEDRTEFAYADEVKIPTETAAP